MHKLTPLRSLAILAAALGLWSCQTNTTINNNSSPDTASSASPSAPAAAAVTSGTLASGNLAPPVETAQTSAPAYPASYYSAPASYDNDDWDGGGEQPVYTEQPPPELPDYDQPECPAENEIWTPGYWNYASAGYYWVPGAWVLAPYVGALWTPPYWGYERGRYRLHRGYWAPHVGFYGGINYGYGYTGRGYYGGYWDRGRFAYNRAVTRVNVTVIRNVYNYNVHVTNIRISYNGGNGGLRAQPTPAEMAVLHERRAAPVPGQLQHAREAANERAQFAQVNHGRPGMAVAPRPLAVAYRAPAPPPAFREARATPEANRPNTLNPMARPDNRPAPEARQPQPTEREARLPPFSQRPSERPAPNVAPPNNPRYASRPEATNERPVPNAAPARKEARPASPPPRVEERPAPVQARPEARPIGAQSESRQPREPRVENRPATPQPQPKVESHPPATAPPPREEARPAEEHRQNEARPSPPPGKAPAPGDKRDTHPHV
ncbi:MAG: YXWGXW repeat-containing protein [Acidobacteriaceae bacterium]|nr:YXWGXW repeat-containing protein [Acidobacteriaceae bacterium]